MLEQGNQTNNKTGALYFHMQPSHQYLIDVSRSV